MFRHGYESLFFELTPNQLGLYINEHDTVNS